MNRKQLISFVVVVIALANPIARGTDKYAYAFDQFAVSKIFRGTPARPRLESVWARTYRTRIKEEVSEHGANFAGHYTLATWGCGAGCVSFAIVDVASGKVFDPPFEVLTTADEAGNFFEGLVFKPDSALLIASGCPQEKDCGTRYYRWNGQKLVLLKTVAGAGKEH